MSAPITSLSKLKTRTLFNFDMIDADPYFNGLTFIDKDKLFVYLRSINRKFIVENQFTHDVLEFLSGAELDKYTIVKKAICDQKLYDCEIENIEQKLYKPCSKKQYLFQMTPRKRRYHLQNCHTCFKQFAHMWVDNIKYTKPQHVIKLEERLQQLTIFRIITHKLIKLGMIVHQSIADLYTYLINNHTATYYILPEADQVIQRVFFMFDDPEYSISLGDIIYAIHESKAKSIYKEDSK